MQPIMVSTLFKHFMINHPFRFANILKETVHCLTLGDFDYLYHTQVSAKSQTFLCPVIQSLHMA